MIDCKKAKNCSEIVNPIVESSELPVELKFWAKWGKGPVFGILAQFLKIGDIFYFNNKKAIRKLENSNLFSYFCHTLYHLR